MESKNRNNKRINIKRDGVIYEPSYNSPYGGGKPKPSPRERVRERQQRQQRQPERRRSRPQPSQFAYFYIVTLFTGVVICIVIFAIVFNSFINTKGLSASSTPKGQIETPAPSEVAFKEVNQITGIISEISKSDVPIAIMDAATYKEYSFYVTGNTALKNKYGQAVVFSELRLGDIVDASFYPEDNKLVSLSASSQSWIQSLVSGLKVDTVNKTVTIGNDTYEYDDKTIITNDHKEASIKDITDIDLVTMRGLKNKVLHIEIIKSHSSIVLTNKDKIIDGTVEVDTSVFMSLEEADTIEVPEGEHRVVIKGANITPFVKEVVVVKNVPFVLDLGEVEVKSGILIVKCDEKDYVLKIDGEVKDAGQPIELGFGEYTVTVEKTGFLPWEDRIIMNEASKEVTAILSKELPMSKLYISTYPINGVDIYIDEIFVGQSPVETSIEYGEHNITTKKEGYVRQDLPYTIDTKEHRITMTLIPKEPTVTDLTAPDNRVYYTPSTDESYDFTP